MQLTSIKIGLADDHPIFRQGLHSIIALEENLKVIWEASNGQEALEKTKESQPDIVILDINMPIMDGIKTAERLSQDFPNVSLVFLSMYKDTQIFDSMKRYHVKGYLLKDSAPEDIVECINSIAQGKVFLTQELTEFLFTNEESETDFELKIHIVSILTVTEKQILRMVSESKTSREIANKLFVSIRTVENHRSNICKKLQLHGNHALVKFALKHKISLNNL
jgi:DNA-binding NarL/FixJ family response regulator